MPTYRSKPIDIQAIQWRGNNEADLIVFGAELRITDEDPPQLQVHDYLQDTWVNVNPRDYIIKGTKGEFYPCDAEVFEYKYALIAP